MRSERTPSTRLRLGWARWALVVSLALLVLTFQRRAAAQGHPRVAVFLLDAKCPGGNGQWVESTGTAFLAEHWPGVREHYALVTALHAVNGCKSLVFTFYGCNWSDSEDPPQLFRATADPFYGWPDLDLAAIPLSDGEVQKYWRPAQMAPSGSVQKDTSRLAMHGVLSNRACPGSTISFNGFISVFKAAQRLKVRQTGSLRDDTILLLYNEGQEGESGAPVTLDADSDQVVGFHDGGSPDGGGPASGYAVLLDSRSLNHATPCRVAERVSGYDPPRFAQSDIVELAKKNPFDSSAAFSLDLLGLHVPNESNDSLAGASLRLWTKFAHSGDVLDGSSVRGYAGVSGAFGQYNQRYLAPGGEVLEQYSGSVSTAELELGVGGRILEHDRLNLGLYVGGVVGFLHDNALPDVLNHYSTFEGGRSDLRLCVVISTSWLLCSVAGGSWVRRDRATVRYTGFGAELTREPQGWTVTGSVGLGFEYEF